MLSWFRALLFITIFVLPHCKIFAGKKSAYTCVESRLIHHVEGVFFFPLYELLSLIHISYVSLCKCTKTNIHCNIYEHSLIVTMVSKKTGKMDTKLDALHVRQL